MLAIAEEQLSTIKRLATGITGLDVILRGGFRQKGLYLFTGVPGTGKTVLGNQLCFNHVAAGGRAVYIGLLSETHTQIFDHLRSMSFFTTEPLMRALYYFSGLETLNTKGLNGLQDMIRHVIHDQHPTLLVMDGLEAVEDAAGSDSNLKRFFYELHALLEAGGCTSFLFAHPGRKELYSPVAGVVDGLITLNMKRIGWRSVRELQIRKFRGSGFMEGRHAFQITDAGLVVYPRTEALPISPPTERNLHVRMSLGVPQLDEMLSGGLLSSSMTMLLGVPGSGKTLLGLQFLGKGAAEKQRGLYFGFNEGPLEVIDSAAHIGLDFTAYLAENLLEVIRQSPIEGILDSLADRLLEAVRQRQVQRLFIDGLAGFQTAADYPERIDRFLKMLTDELRALNVTTVFSVELNNLFGPTIEIPIKGISVLTDNILFLRYAELHSHLIRLVSILKTRRSGNDPAIREFRITDKGIAVADTFTSVEAILSGFSPALQEMSPQSRLKCAVPDAISLVAIPDLRSVPNRQDIWDFFIRNGVR